MFLVPNQMPPYDGTPIVLRYAYDRNLYMRLWLCIMHILEETSQLNAP